MPKPHDPRSICKEFGGSQAGAGGEPVRSSDPGLIGRRSTWCSSRGRYAATMTSTGPVGRLRVVVGGAGLAGGDHGLEAVARALRDAGHEVIYAGLAPDARPGGRDRDPGGRRPDRRVRTRRRRPRPPRRAGRPARGTRRRGHRRAGLRPRCDGGGGHRLDRRGRASGLRSHVEGELHLLTGPSYVAQREPLRGDAPRQHRRTGPEEDRAQPDPDLVEVAGVVVLADEVPAADQPDVALARRGHDLVDGPGHVAAHEVQVDARHRRQVPVGEHPAGPVLVVALPLLGVREQVVVGEHPLVGRRPHHHRADAPDELVPGPVVRVAGHLEEPVERVVVIGDEPVQRGGGEVDDPGHGADATPAAGSYAVRHVESPGLVGTVRTGLGCPGDTCGRSSTTGSFEQDWWISGSDGIPGEGALRQA